MQSKFLILAACASLALFHSGCSSSDSASSGTLEQNLASVSTNFIPASLTYSTGGSGSNSLLTKGQAPSGDPCAEFNDPSRFKNFLSCQPNLVRLYLSMAKEIFAIVVDLVTEINAEIEEIAVGVSEETITEDDFTIKVKVNKTSDSDYRVLLSSEQNQPLVYLDVKPNSYTFKGDLAFEGDDMSGLFATTINFTNSNEWSNTVTVVDINEPGSDAPTDVQVQVKRNGDIWTGVAMTRHPETLPTNCQGAECNINIYTAFVADKNAAKANVYMLKDDDVLATDAANRNLNAWCELMPDCSNGNFANPFCKPTTGNLTWGQNTCPNDGDAVAETAISEADFLAISDFIALAVELPTTVTP